MSKSIIESAEMAVARIRLRDAYGTPCPRCMGRGGAIGGGEEDECHTVGPEYADLRGTSRVFLHSYQTPDPRKGCWEEGDEPWEWVYAGRENIPVLAEAAAREGVPFLVNQIGHDGRQKVVLMAAPAELVRQFLAGKIVPGLVDYYGDPEHGFAGGYLS